MATTNEGIRISQVRAGDAALRKDTSSTTDAVKIVQTMLNAAGYNCGTPDGKFGNNTETAAKNFQSAQNLTSDGIVGKNTLLKLDSIVGVNCGVEIAMLEAGTASLAYDAKLRASDAVRTMQTRLNEIGFDCGTPDGKFGSNTETKVKEFQTAANLTADGKVGRASWQAMKEYQAQPDDPDPEHDPDSSTNLREGNTGAAVLELQNKLNALKYDCGTADGIFDRQMTWAVKWFQYRNNVAADGIVGPSTIAKVNSLTAVKGLDVSALAWAKGDVPQLYRQNHDLWRDYPYDASGTSKVETMAGSACGPTSMAMVVSSFIGMAVLPPVLGDWAVSKGYRDAAGSSGTLPIFFTKCAEKYGFHCTTINGGDNFTAVRNCLNNGGLVVVSVGAASPYTNASHLMVIYDIDANNKVHILNPNSRTTSNAYPISDWQRGSWAHRFQLITK